MEQFEFLYPVAVTLLFLIVYFFFHLKLGKIERKRLKHLDKCTILDAVETESPLEDQEQFVKDKGIEATEYRFSFLRKALPVFMFVIWITIIFMPYLGQVPTVYISIITAVVSVVIGIALRPFLENLFAGVVISFFKSLRVGDTVIIDGEYGIIEEISLTYSILKRWDWNRIIIPNTKMIQKEIENLTLTDQYLWAHVEFFVEPNTDIELVKKIAIQAAEESPHFNKTETPSFWIMDLQRDAIRCWIAAWVDNAAEAWELKSDIRTKLAINLKNLNIRYHSNYFERVDHVNANH